MIANEIIIQQKFKLNEVDISNYMTQYGFNNVDHPYLIVGYKRLRRKCETVHTKKLTALFQTNQLRKTNMKDKNQQ